MAFIGANPIAVLRECKALFVIGRDDLAQSRARNAVFSRCLGDQLLNICPSLSIESQSYFLRLMAQDEAEKFADGLEVFGHRIERYQKMRCYSSAARSGESQAGLIWINAPVRLARNSGFFSLEDVMFEKILVAVDGSEHSNHAIDIACDIAGRYDGASVEIVHAPVIDLPSPTLGAAGAALLPDMKTLMAEAQTIVDKACDRAIGAGCADTVGKVLRGDPAEAIVAEAGANNATLIVAGRRGLGKLKGLLLGSVSQKLNTHAKCPVLTVG